MVFWFGQPKHHVDGEISEISGYVENKVFWEDVYGWMLKQRQLIELGLYWADDLIALTQPYNILSI